MTAIVVTLAFILKGTLREVVIWSLLVLLVLAIGTFLDGHRVVGNIRKDYRLKKGRDLKELRSRQWHPELGNAIDGNERVLAVALRFPKVDSIWRDAIFGPIREDDTRDAVSNPITIIAYGEGDKEVCRCNQPELVMFRWFTAAYPRDFGPSAPTLSNAKLTFKWFGRDGSVLASAAIKCDNNGNLELTRREKLAMNNQRLRKYIQHLKQPL